MDRPQLQYRINRAWTAFTQSYSGLEDPQILEPNVTGNWSVRDIIAHVSTWEQEALTHLPLTLEGGRSPRYSVTYGGIDAFNAKMTERKSGLSLREVREQQTDIHRLLIDFIDGVSEDEFTGETRFRRRLRLDTYGHYPKHALAILKWRGQQAI